MSIENLVVRKRELVNKLLNSIVFKTYENRPGAVINKLSADEIEICKKLNYTDFNHRFHGR